MSRCSTYSSVTVHPMQTTLPLCYLHLAVVMLAMLVSSGRVGPAIPIGMCPRNTPRHDVYARREDRASKDNSTGAWWFAVRCTWTCFLSSYS